MDYWIKNDKTKAIWYYAKYKEWSIGSIEYLGTQWRGVAAEHTSASCPTQNTNRWHFYDGTTWKPNLKSHIHVQCEDNFSDFYKPGIYLLFLQVTHLISYLNDFYVY